MVEVDFTSWNVKDSDNIFKITRNKISWTKADRKDNRRIFKNFGDDYFVDFQHMFKIKFTKINSESKASRTIIGLWDCRNDSRNRIWVCAHQIGDIKDKWKVVIAQNIDGKQSILYDGIYTFDINVTYIFNVKKVTNYFRLKIYNEGDIISILEDSDDLFCGDVKYSTIWLLTLKKSKRNGDYSTGYVENIDFQNIHERPLQVSSIQINNYRPISSIKLEELKPITVFVGRNNVGKSAILEGIALATTARYGWYDSLGKDIISQIIIKRGGYDHADTMIKVNEIEASISISGIDVKRKINISKNIISLSDESSSKISHDVNEYLDSLIRRYGTRSVIRTIDDQRIRRREEDPIAINKINLLKDNIWEYFPIFIEHIDDLFANIEYTAISGDKLSNEISSIFEERVIGIKNLFKSSKTNRSNTTFLLTTSLEYLRELQKRLAINGKLLNLIKNLREKIYYLEDIRQIDNQFLIFFKGIDKPLPIESTGDGFRAELSMFSAIATMDKGIIIMEEPECRLHPGFIDSVVKEIIRTAEDEQIQYFISTHSLEFIEYLLDENPNLIKIVRMYRDDVSGEIDYEIFTGEMALEEINTLKLDLRGV